MKFKKILLRKILIRNSKSFVAPKQSFGLTRNILYYDKKKDFSANLVLDASAILHSDLDFSGGDYLIPGSILDEIHDEIARIAVHSAINDGRMRIKNPAEFYIKKVTERAKETGDLGNLSRADIDVLALALEDNLTIITDDYGIQNVAKELGLEFQRFVQEGIKKGVYWKKVCQGCGREHPMNLKICKICGSMLKKIAKPPE